MLYIYTQNYVCIELDDHYNNIIGTSCTIHQCKCCGKFISDRVNFCSQSCSTTFTNKARAPKSQVTKDKISNSLKRRNVLKLKPSFEIVGPFTKVNHTKCAHCGIISVTRIVKKYCADCSHIYGAEPRNRCNFTFNVYTYPELFNLVELNQVGFYAPRGKSGRWNPNGLSRDHKVSVNESLRYNYDPFYITHPLNCELMPHKENNKKKTNSSITYSQLVTAVDLYEAGRTSKNVCSTN